MKKIIIIFVPEGFYKALTKKAQKFCDGPSFQTAQSQQT